MGRASYAEEMGVLNVFCDWEGLRVPHWIHIEEISAHPSFPLPFVIPSGSGCLTQPLKDAVTAAKSVFNACKAFSKEVT